MKRFVGTWKLVSWEHRKSNGDIYYPMGKDALGQITYTDDGYMHVALMTTNRPLFKSNGLFAGSMDEKAKSSETFIAYCGRYTVKDKSVIHHLDMCSFPNWTGVSHERFFEFQNKQLSLRTPPFSVKDNEQEIAYLIWEKI
jgi:Lipocalin-like domain